MGYVEPSPHFGEPYEWLIKRHFWEAHTFSTASFMPCYVQNCSDFYTPFVAAICVFDLASHQSSLCTKNAEKHYTMLEPVTKAIVVESPELFEWIELCMWKVGYILVFMSLKLDQLEQLPEADRLMRWQVGVTIWGLIIQGPLVLWNV